MNIKDRQEYTPDVAALFCGEIRGSSHECEDGGSEHICEEGLNHAGSHVCRCGYSWNDEVGGCC